jgi:riboflavin kinase / FMN adenylyltransferase
MIVVDWNELTPGGRLKNRRVRLTIGVFDGLHMGHRRLIKGVVEGPGDVLPLVITFRDSPVWVLSPDSFPGLILSSAQKISRLDALGIGAVVLIDFSSEMSNLSGEAFIALLKENLAIEKIVVGSNFRFGRGREAGPGDLKEMLSDTGTEVQVTEPVLWGDRVVSSSRIRKTIQEASFSETGAMLAAAYAIDLRGVRADRSGAHAIRVGRNELKQVLPRVGRYPVTCQGETGLAAGEVEIRETCLILDSPVADTATSIIFEHAT